MHNRTLLTFHAISSELQVVTCIATNVWTGLKNVILERGGIFWTGKIQEDAE